MNTFTPLNAITITTPQKVLLNGFWLGPQKPLRVVVWVHGLTSSAWSRHALLNQVVNDETAVLVFSNRGHDVVSRISTVKGKGKSGGTAHEVFTECADDIQGAINFAKKQGARDIFLGGHSTGCQKSIYWAHRAKAKGVKGIILLAPLSDYPMSLRYKQKRVAAEKVARMLVKKRTPHALLPTQIWHETLDAQRFLSLNTPDSIEQSIFTYFDPRRAAKVFSSVTVPIIAFFAGKDEYGDRPAHEIAEWFVDHTGAHSFGAHILPKATHTFKGSETEVARILALWITGLQAR